MSAGSPLKNTIKLPPELLQAMGAYAEAAKAIRDDMKATAKEIADRTRELGKAGVSDADIAGDKRIRDLTAREHALKQQQEENERQRKANDESMGNRVSAIESRLGWAHSAVGTVGRVAAGGIGVSDLGRAASWVERKGYQVATAEGASASAVQWGMRLAEAGQVMTGAARLIVPGLAIGTALTAVMSVVAGQFGKMSASSKAAEKIAEDVIKQLQSDQEKQGLEGEWVHRARMAQETEFVRQKRSEEGAENPIERAVRWATGLDTVETTNAAKKAAEQEMRRQEAIRVLGRQFAEASSLERLVVDRNQEFRNRLLKKIIPGGDGQLGFIAGTASSFAFSARQLVSGGGELDRMKRETLQEMQADYMKAQITRMDTRDRLMDMSEDERLRYKTEMKQRNLWLDSRRARDYETSLQWNAF